MNACIINRNPTNATARATVNTFASMLAARFNPIVGCTRSWDAADPEDFQVIIDNMMNLEVRSVVDFLFFQKKKSIWLGKTESGWVSMSICVDFG